MIDVTRIKERIERDLGKPKSRNSRYSTYKCPLHHEEKGFSLVVYEDHWRCFGKCGRGGDAIAWLQEYHNLPSRKPVNSSHRATCRSWSSLVAPSSQSLNRRPNPRTLVGRRPLKRWLTRRWIRSGARKANAPSATSQSSGA